MATPLLTKNSLDGGLGPILVDVRAPSGAGSRPAVVMLHGFEGFKDYAMFPALGERLARAGFTAVSFNASGSGVDDRGGFVWPERFRRNTFPIEIADLLLVIHALRTGTLGPAPSSVGVLGHSRGGGTAVLAAARDPGVHALVTWASISDVGEGIDLARAARSLEIPWLIVHGDHDETVPYSQAEALFAASGRESTRLVTIPGGNHGFGATHPYAGPTPELERVFDATVSWFSRHLP